MLTIEHLSKTFPGQRALDDVSFDIAAGEVHALVGQNGCGKSTLIKVLAGFHVADPGATFSLDGEAFSPSDRQFQARRAIQFIHQDLGLVSGMSTAENLALGRSFLTARSGRIRWHAERDRARRLLEEFGVDFDVTQPVSTLTQAERTTVAILRAVGGESTPRVLVLDEPTAALPEREAGRLFELVEQVVERGTGVLFVSHHLGEVFAHTDRTTVLRDGKCVASVSTRSLDHDGLVQLIVGRSVTSDVPRTRTADRDRLLSVVGMRTALLDSVDFHVGRGEILGFAGLIGSGREHVAGAIFGLVPDAELTMDLDGVALPRLSAAHALRLGLALVPSERQVRGGIATMTARENVTLPLLAPVTVGGVISKSKDKADSLAWLSGIGLAPLDPERNFAQFSGGNQQKAVLAKCVRLAPRVLLLEEPTQGVDIGAKAAIFDVLRQLAENGTGIIVCSSDDEELALLCDRVLVLRDGSIAAALEGDDLVTDRLVAAAIGHGTDDVPSTPSAAPIASHPVEVD